MTAERNPWSPNDWAVSNDKIDGVSLPHISIGVLNFNRCDALRQTLDVLTNAIQYPSYETIVIDNGSTDGSIEMIHSDYPNVLLYEVGENRGVSSRNIQAELATGKYLFSFDDDTSPATPAMLYRMVEYMEKRSDVDAICGHYYQVMTGFEEMQDWDRLASNIDSEVECFSPPEGGICFRLSAWKETEGYEKRFLCYGEGQELAIQLYKINRRIVYHASFAVLHFVIPARILTSRLNLQWRHTIWIFAKHWPRTWLPGLLAAWTARRILGVLMHPGLLAVTAKSWREGLAGIGPFLKYRPKLTHKQAASLMRFYLQLFRW